MAITCSTWLPKNNEVNTYKHLLQLFAGHITGHIQSLRTMSPPELYAPEEYILSLGGKRVRPLLSLIACELCGADPRRALDVALSVELFHNFSLIHDDILDAAPLRRQQPTVHQKFGSNVAILAGDVMLVKALRALKAYDPAEHKTLATMLEDTAVQVCEGQQMDMNFERTEDVSVEEYITMITLKTAVLLGCSLAMGSVCAGAPEQTRRSLYNFGKHIGIAFQLLDDLLDCFPGESFGKQVGGDICANKKTFLLLKAYELSKDSGRKELRRLMTTDSDPGRKVREVTGIFSSLGVDRLCRERADHHTATAIGILEELNCDAARKEDLKNFATGLLQRSV